MTTNPQGQRSWNTFQSQSVAGRPCPPRSVEQSTCKPASDIWLMRTPSECSSGSYRRSLADAVDLRSAYGRDTDSYRSHPLIVDGDIGFEDTTLSSTRDVCDYLIHFSSTSSIFSDVDHDDFEFDDSDSDTDVDSDSDSEAQYITIPPGSPWWKAPPSSNSVSFDTLVDNDDFDQDDALPSGQSLSEVLEQQQLLVGVFHDELRRIIPGHHQYEDDWLSEVDAKLLLAPVESFEDTCRRTMKPASRPLSTDFGSKPLPDVPVDFDAENDDDEASTEGWEWEYPPHTHHVNFVNVHPISDPHFVKQKVH